MGRPGPDTGDPGLAGSCNSPGAKGTICRTTAVRAAASVRHARIRLGLQPEPAMEILLK